MSKLMCKPDCCVSTGLGCTIHPTTLVQHGVCAAYPKLIPVLRQYFGHDEFRPGQVDAILSVLHGHDVFVRMATGSGKSVCMYLPPLVYGKPAVAIIISPLIGLMEEQVRKLLTRNIQAIRASGDNRVLYKDVACGKFQFVFMSPETAITTPWKQLYCERFVKQHLVLIAIDEAHCIHEWGQDFRKAFSHIGDIRAHTSVPIMSLTASAPPSVMSDLTKSLHMKDPVFVKHSLNRPNTFYSVAKKSGICSDLNGLAEMLATSDDPCSIPKTIVFFATKEQTVDGFLFLQKSAAHKHYVGAYHASLTEETKFFVRQNFASRTTEMRCLCATVAFGMGMDIPDIRLVIVYWVPSSISQFYQMSGRAGRDGSTSVCHLIVNAKQVKNSKDEALKHYCSFEDKENCRRRYLLHHLGDDSSFTVDPANCCDCCNKNGVPYPDLKLALKRGKRKRKKKHSTPVARCLSSTVIREVKLKLLDERKRIMQSSVGLEMLGEDGVCHTATIDKLCEQCKYITSIDDIEDTPGLRPHLFQPFFDTIMRVLNLNETSTQRQT